MVAMVTEIPAPAWKRTRNKANSRVPLSRDLIVATALRLLDQDGLDGVSMRRVAEELGTGAASLYAHVANKEELLDLVHDQVMAEITVPEPDPEHWQEQLREVVMRSYDVYQQHRDVAGISLGTIPTGPNALRIAEGMLSIMLAGGVPPRVAGWMLDRLALYIASDAYEASVVHKRHQASGKPLDEFLNDYYEQLESFYRSLPRDRFPLLVEHLDDVMGGDGRERFAFGLDMIIRSLASQADQARTISGS